MLASSLATWAIIKIGVARSPAGEMGKVIPWLVFAVVMGHLAIKSVGNLSIFVNWHETDGERDQSYKYLHR